MGPLGSVAPDMLEQAFREKRRRGTLVLANGLNVVGCDQALDHLGPTRGTWDSLRNGAVFLAQ